MLQPRVIPCLLLKGRGFVKTVKFDKPAYLGDPVNIVKIFNDKEVDEISILDITATKEGREPQFDLLEEIASEAFMPLTCGGGIRSLATIRRILRLGVEKVALNSAVAEDQTLIRDAADLIGSSSVVASIDVKKSLLGKYTTVTPSGKGAGRDPVEVAVIMQAAGAGEILLQAVDRDGTMKGYDMDLVRRVTRAVDIPVIAAGGASGVSDLVAVMQEAGAAAAGAGALFVYQGPHRAVLISYPAPDTLKSLFRITKDTNL